MVHQHHRHLHGARDLSDFLDDLGNAVGLGNSKDKAQKREGSTRYVYVTQSPTFTEPIAGYSTSQPGSGETSTPILLDSSTPKPTPKSTAQHKASTTAEKPKTTPAPTALSGLPKSIVPSSTVDTSNSDVLLASQTEATSETPTPTISPSSTPSAIANTAPSGMTGGAKAGLAIGIVVVIAAILSLIFFCFRQRKKAEERERMDDEKFTNVAPPSAAAAAGGPASMRGLKRLSTAPRLDVRPTTAFFMPNRASQMQNPNANAAGNGIQMTSQNRGMEQNNRANPFGNHAESIDPVNAAGPSVVDGVSAAGVVVAGAAAASARGPVRSTSRGAQNKYSGNKSAQSPFSDAARTDGNIAMNTSQQMHNTGVMPQPLAGVIEESNGSGSPASPVSPTQAAAAMVGAGAVTSGAASNTSLYRVHLDFSPSMPDELRVRAGEIVKLLKEFDDGWCMCIKEDGSSEGVLPRTCISNSPIAARRSPSNKSNKSVPGPFQNGQRRHSPTSSNAPLYPSHQNQNQQQQQQQQGPNQNQGQNRAGPPMNQNGRGPQYRPQQQGPPTQGRPQQGRPQGPNQQGGRPMSPAMSANGNGRNSPGPGNYGGGPQYRPQQGPGPMSPGMNRGPAQQAQQQGQQGQSSPPPHAISSPSSSAAQVGSSSPVAAAAQVALPSSPALSQANSGFSIPEVTITAPSGSAAPVVERKMVGRKPVPGN
ncbi:hypothetical protein VF21_08638 [Pseudogymnoascus sp. 05NY08]|nr:hypothetical protein VF21_08638 [Pseudogymnoascus sp. 05NY08]